MAHALKKFGTWLLTDSGKTYVGASAIVSSVGLGCCFFLPHTFCINQYRDFVHLYRHGFKASVPPVLLDRFNKTLELLEIPQIDKKQYKPFMVYGFDIFSAGSYFSRFGTIIGMPITFTHLDADFVDTDQIQINDTSVPWEMPEGKLLYKSLLVPEKAQMYAIAKEIEIRNTVKFLIDWLNPSVLALMAYMFGKRCNERYNLYARSRATRFMLYGLVVTFFGANYIFIKDALQVYNEKRVDTYLIEKNEVFREGGKEYYDLILKRNIALRTLMGKLGVHNFTPNGNENYLIRQKHLPLVQRKAFFDGNLEQS